MVYVKRMALFADRYISVLNKLMLYMGTLIVLYLLLTVSYYVATRYFLGWPNTWISETARFALLFIVFLPLGYSQSIGQHIKVDALTSKLSPRVNARLAPLATVISLGAFIIFAWSTVHYATLALDRGYDTGPLYYWPIFPMLVIMPIGAGMLALQLFITLIKQIAALTPGKDKKNKTEDVTLGGVSISKMTSLSK